MLDDAICWENDLLVDIRRIGPTNPAVVEAALDGQRYRARGAGRGVDAGRRARGNASAQPADPPAARHNAWCQRRIHQLVGGRGLRVADRREGGHTIAVRLLTAGNLLHANRIDPPRSSKVPTDSGLSSWG